MEATDNKEKQNSATNSNSFDLNSVMDNSIVGELIKHLLSAGGAVAANYFVFIKPMQEKLDDLTDRVKKQEATIEELEKYVNELVDELNQKGKPQKEEPELEGNEEYFHVSRRDKHSSAIRKRRR